MPRSESSNACRRQRFIYVHGTSKAAVASKLTNAMVKIRDWLNHCSLQLNLSKTVGMFFSKTTNSTADPDIFITVKKNPNCFQNLNILVFSLTPNLNQILFS